MNTPELRVDSTEIQTEDLEPLPTTEDRLLEHLEYIRQLWNRHAETLTADPKAHEIVKATLREAYEVIFTIEPFLKEHTTELLLQPSTLEAARFELWFAGYHLHKVIK